MLEGTERELLTLKTAGCLCGTIPALPAAHMKDCPVPLQDLCSGLHQAVPRICQHWVYLLLCLYHPTEPINASKV